MPWPDAVDEVLAGDQVVMLGSVTPAEGVVLTPVTNFGLRDRWAGTVTVNSSVGAWKKLERIRLNPRVALAFHTRRHSRTDRSELVLAQGTASISAPIADYPAKIGESWERFDGPRAGGLWRRWLRAYETRVDIEVVVNRMVVWPDLAASGAPSTHGPAPATQPLLRQQPPRGGTGPRVDLDRATRAVGRLPHVLLGWVDADGFPQLVPVELAGQDGNGLLLRAAPDLLPAGERRAGLTAHAFTRHVIGQHQRVYTGWLRSDAESGQAVYAPHTAFGYRMPPSKLVYRLAVGYATRQGQRSARRRAGS